MKLSHKQRLGKWLEDDAYIRSVLTGGIYYAHNDISRTLQPLAFNNSGIIKPCALIKLTAVTPITNLGFQTSIDLIMYEPLDSNVCYNVLDYMLPIMDKQPLVNHPDADLWTNQYDMRLVSATLDNYEFILQAKTHVATFDITWS